MHNNIFEISIAVLPVFLYMFLMLKIIPKQMVYQSRAKRYIIAGMTAPIVVMSIVFMLPTIFNNEYMCFTSSLQKFLHYDYIQAGFLEETTKLLTFFYVYKGRRNAIFDLPIAIIFYNMACSAGFALTENIYYAFQYGNVIERSYSAVLLHMITGIIMGFFLQRALTSKQVLIEKTSNKERWKPIIIKVKIIGQGLIAATLFHGTYNFNFSLPVNNYSGWNMTVMLILGVVIVKLMINEGVRLSKELRRKNYKKDYYENFGQNS